MECCVWIFSIRFIFYNLPHKIVSFIDWKLLDVSLCTRRMTESNPLLDKYMSLDQGDRVQVLYVWIDGTGENLRCKTRTVDSEPVEPGDLPIWNFDGSSTFQAEGCNSDVYLHPVALFRDPFRRGKNKIALCETYNFDHKPGVSNHRLSCFKAMEHKKVKVSHCCESILLRDAIHSIRSSFQLVRT